MSYLTQANLAADQNILLRVTACSATQHIGDPQAWAYQHQWRLSAQPGWVSAYSSAKALHESSPDTAPPPGANPAGITDAMILSAVQSINSDPAE